MKAAKKPGKLYWEMNAEELARATREFDSESDTDKFQALSREKQLVWQRLQKKGKTKGKRLPDLKRVCSQKDVAALRKQITKAAEALGGEIKKIAACDPLEVLKYFKLERLGFDPFDPSQKMNLMEQINQSATLLVACAAAERLLRKHPSQDGYVISRPTTRGFDLWAVDASVAAEVFAATSPASNQKIKKDLEAVQKDKEPFCSACPPRHRYIFFVSRSSEGFPGYYRFEEEDDPELGEKVWYLADKDGRRSVTVVPLSEMAVFHV